MGIEGRGQQEQLHNRRQKKRAKKGTGRSPGRERGTSKTGKRGVILEQFEEHQA